MPSLSLAAARKLESLFQGRITSTHASQAEFRGKPTVLIPESTSEIEQALRLARAAGLPVFVRSGNSVSASDIGKTTATRKSTDAVVSMEAFRNIIVEGSRVTVGAAATTGDVARELAKTNLFLPLGDNPTQSIVSAVLSMNTSPFLRSAAGGALRDAVVAAEVVPTEGTGAGKTRTIQRQALRDLLAGEKPAVIANLVFDASATKADETGRWMKSWMAVYEPKSFAKLCDQLFGNTDSLPAHVDLSVRVTSAAYAMKLVIVRTTGQGGEDRVAADSFVQSALDGSGIHFLKSKSAVTAGASIDAWMSTGANVATEGETLKRFGSNIAPRPFAKFRKEFLDAVNFAIGVSSRTGKKRASGVRAWFELQLAADGNVVTRAEMFDVHATSKIAEEALRRLTEAIPADKVSPKAAIPSRALVRRGAARAIARGVSVLPSFAPTTGFSLTSTNRPGSAIIPGFKGEIYDAAAGQQYQKQIQQYAVSSYTPQVVAARMTPLYVAMPLDAADVALAVKYAADNNLKIVTRSGGHQYCGLSSGGKKTLLLDMKLFNKVVFSPATGTPTQVTVGPGVALKDVSKMLRAREVAIPHGECPLVRLGGHVQTGGIGHQLRSLGATLDWVSSFKLVTRDPQVPDAYREQTFTRPQAGGTSLTDDVFRAVLGGGPSSWGVLTEITFDLVSDKKFPTSEGYSRTYLYEKEGFRAAFEQFRQWAVRQAAGKLPQGIDYFLSVVSGDFDQLRPGALLVEMMSTDAAGASELTTVTDAVDAAVSFFDRVASKIASPLEGPAGVSEIADKGVREIGTFGLPASGREFDLPYKKSLHITMKPFTKAFADAFVDLVDEVYNHDNLKVVVQTVIGGGEFLANGKKNLSHMQRRDALVQLVFDVFYDDSEDDQAKTDAEDFQNRMKGLLNQFSGGADIRMLWGTFEDPGTGGEQLDIRRTEVQNLYYDSQAEYAKLKQIKSAIDPSDIFHTSFTVQ